MTVLDCIQFVLHFGSKAVIHNGGKIFYHQTVGNFAQRSRNKRLTFPLYVIASQNGRNNGGIRAGASDIQILQCLNQRSIVIAYGRLGKVLCQIGIVCAQCFSLTESRQPNILNFGRIICLLALLILTLLIDRHIARKSNRISAGAENIPCAGKINADGIQNGGFHLAGNKAFPNQLI